MAGSRSAYVVDATVLIDLHAGGILEPLGRMSGQFLVPDLVAAEIDEPDPKLLARAGLELEALSGSGVVEVMKLARQNRRISVADASALVLAARFGCVLLTGDRRLRELARTQDIEVHGTLWLLERMVAAGVLSRKQAASGLARMLDCGRRLPVSESRELIRNWQG